MTIALYSRKGLDSCRAERVVRSRCDQIYCLIFLEILYKVDKPLAWAERQIPTGRTAGAELHHPSDNQGPDTRSYQTVIGTLKVPGLTEEWDQAVDPRLRHCDLHWKY